MTRVAWLTQKPVAHRGYHGRATGLIENTLSAAAAAVDRDFAVECDVQLSADGDVIVFHDDTLDRLTGTSGPVRDKTLAELQAVELKGTGDRIPTLSALCEAIGGRVPLFVELKSAGDGDQRLEQRTAEILADYDGPVAVMSFDPRMMMAIRKFAPALPRGMVADRFDDEDSQSLSPIRRFALRHLLYAPVVRPDFVAYDIGAIPANAPLLLHHLGVPLLTWTVRTDAERETARRHADQIIFEDFDPAATGTVPAQPV